MKPVYENATYVLDENGDIDVNHYIDKAHRLRSDAAFSLSFKASDSVESAISHMTSLFQAPKVA